MPDEEVVHGELRAKTKLLLNGTLKHVRVVALAASLVPLGAVTVSPLLAQCPYNCPPPPVSVPEPSSMALLGTSLAGFLIAKRYRK